MDAVTAFNLSVQMVLVEEGGMSDDAVNDPNGGLTKFGIAQKQNPTVDVKNLTQAQAVAIYKSKYWDPNHLDQMPWPICMVTFDIDVNNGPSMGAKMLQRALGVEDDGYIMLNGETLTALGKVKDLMDLAKRMLAKRAVYYTTLGNWEGNAEGWMYRTATVALNCARYA